MKMYRCIRECYPGHLIREGEVVEERYAFPRRCFTEVTKGTTVEVEEGPQLMSNADIVQARAKVQIAGGGPEDEKPKRVYRRKKEE